MTTIGITSTASKLKDKVKVFQDKGLDVFGVSLINDLEGKHEVIKSSNAQMHLFMQMKKGVVTKVLFEDAEQASIFMDNMRAFFGSDKVAPVMDSTSWAVISDSSDCLSGLGLKDVSSYPDEDSFLGSI